jgi:hypothetical protein
MRQKCAAVLSRRLGVISNKMPAETDAHSAIGLFQ